MIPFVTGPLLWFSCLFFAAGCLVRLIWPYAKLFSKSGPRKLGKQREADIWRAPSTKKQRQGTSDPVPLSLPTWGLVLLVLVLPLFYQGHAELISLRWRLAWPAIPLFYSDVFGTLALAAALLGALGLVVLPKNSGSRRPIVFALMLGCALPFFTGLMARYRMPGYEGWMIAHVLLGEALLLAIPCTGLFNIFFFFLPSGRSKADSGEK